MCFDLGRIRNNIRQMFACVCIIACAGPAMFIAGIIFLVKENTRADDINAWKTSIAAYDSTDAGVMARTTATLNTVTLPVTTVYISAEGDQTDLPSSVSSTRLVGSSITPASTYEVEIGVADVVDNVTTNITVTAPISKLTSTSVKCTKSYCTSSCSDSNYRCGSISTRACSGGTYSGSTSCYSGDTCGTCTRTVYINSFCTPLTLTGGNGTNAAWGTSSIGTACTYPFTDQTYSTASASTITGTVLSDQDPYVSLQRITSGSNDFGMTAEDQHKIGVGLLVAGIVIAVIVYGCLAAALYYFCFRNEEGAAASSTTGPSQFSGAGANTQLTPVKVQPGVAPSYPSQFSTEPSYPPPPPQSAPYGQPQPAPYGQPQPAPYGQPQPTPYGQPIPYGQPVQPAPSPYGQSAPIPYAQPAAYGQPVPSAPYGQPAPYGAPPPASGVSVAAFGMPPPQV